MNYLPTPIDTTSIEIPNSLKFLAELLAINTHENWSKQRIKEGWSYGHKRDDLKKTHPCIIPYHELTEGEKKYDIITSTEVIKVILSYGYTITKE